jgi:DNA gyrase/topoisomerase IV subunit B
MSIKFKRLEATGLKGGDIVVDLASANVLVVGPNGSRKSTIRNALEFVFGLAMDGAASQKGQGIIGLVSGDVLAVTVNVEVDGVGLAICRRRVRSGATFKNAAVEINGQPATDADLSAALGGVVDVGAGAALLAASPDALRAELASIALRIGAAGKEGMPTTAAGLEAERVKRKDALNTANRNAKAAASAMESSRKAAPDSTVRPEAVEAAKARAASLRGEHEDWSRRVGEAEANLSAVDRAVATYNARRDRAVSAFKAASEAVRSWSVDSRGLGEPAWSDKVTKARADVEAAETHIEEAERLHESERDAAATASEDKVRARAAVDSAKAAVASLNCDTCPTCKQSVTAELRGAFDAVLKDAEAMLVAVTATHAAAVARVADAAAKLRDAGTAAREKAAALNAAKDGLAAAKRATEAAASLDAAKAELAIVDGTKADGSTDRHALAETLAEVRRSRPNVDGAENEIERLTREQAAHARFVTDTRARDAADKAVADAKAAVKALADYEATLTEAAETELKNAATAYLPAGWALDFVDGAIGLQDSDGVRWFGAGLSGAQLKILEVALTEAVFSATGAAVRLAFVEADELEGRALEALMLGLGSATAFEALHLALVISCHPVAGVTDAWQVIETVAGFNAARVTETEAPQKGNIRAPESFGPVAVAYVGTDEGVVRFGGGFAELVEVPVDDDGVAELFEATVRLVPSPEPAAREAEGIVGAFGDGCSTPNVEVLVLTPSALEPHISEVEVEEPAPQPEPADPRQVGLAFTPAPDVVAPLTWSKVPGILQDVAGLPVATTPEGRTLTEREVSGILRDMAPGTAALRALVGDGVKHSAAEAYKRATQALMPLAVNEAALRACVTAVAERYPKRPYGARDGEGGE